MPVRLDIIQIVTLNATVAFIMTVITVQSMDHAASAVQP